MDNQDNLIYWYVWNVEKNMPGISEMSKKELKEEKERSKNIHEIFHYRIFKNSDLQLYDDKQDGINFSTETKKLKKNSLGGVDRVLNLQFELQSN